MKYQTVFHLLSALFKEKNINCILIGGFAVNYYKVTRQTVDVDFLITKDDFERILVLLQQEDYQQDYAQEVFSRLRTKSDYLLDIDFMFVNSETLNKIIKDGKEIDIAGQKFTIPSLEHLIALKLHAIKYNPKIRENKDLSDIINMIKVNRMDVKRAEFKEMCLKYGTEELYNKILQAI